MTRIQSQESSAQPRTAKSSKNMVQTSLKVAFAIGLIYWMIHTGKLDLNTFIQLSTPSLIAFCLACVFIQIFFNNYRWLVLLQGQGIRSSIRHTLPLSFIGMFFNFVMPGGVGGDVIKGYYLLKDFPHKKYAAAMSIFMDRMIGFFVMIATAFLAVFFNWDSVSHSPELRSIAVGVTLLFLCFIIFFAVALSRRLGRRIFDSWFGVLIFQKMPGGARLRRVYDAFHEYRKEPWKFVLASLISVINQFLLVAFVVGVAFAMGMGIHDIPLAVYFFLVPLGTVTMALPISPAGIGVGQAAFYFLFSLYLGKSSLLGPTAVTAMQVTNFFWGLLGAYFYMSRKKPIIPAEV